MNPLTFEFNTPIEVRFADLDAYGHVNNAIFFTYLENARVKLFKQRFGPFLESEMLFIVVRSECDYLVPIELDDPLQISVAVEQITFTSFTFAYHLHNGDGKTYAKAKTVIVSYDPKIKKPAAIPVKLKKVLSGKIG